MIHLINACQKHLVLIAWFVALCACGGSGTTIAGNPNINGTQPVITISKLVSGKATITIPLGVFGDDSAAVDGAAIDIDRNDSRLVSDIDAIKYFHDDSESVVFALNSLASGDVLIFFITQTDDSEDTYLGLVSGDEDTYAVSVEATVDAANLIEPALTIIHLAATDGRMSETFSDNSESPTSSVGELIALHLSQQRFLTTRNAASQSEDLDADFASDCNVSGNIHITGTAHIESNDSLVSWTMDYHIDFDNCEQEIEVDVADGHCDFTQKLNGSVDGYFSYEQQDGIDYDETPTEFTLANGSFTLTENGNSHSLSLNAESSDVDFSSYADSVITGSVIVDGLGYDIFALDSLTENTVGSTFCPGDFSSGAASNSADTDIDNPSTVN